MPPAIQCTVFQIAEAATIAAIAGLRALIGWAYFPHLIIFSAIGIGFSFCVGPYRNWHVGWLSYQIEQSIRGMRNAKRAKEANKHQNNLTAHVLFDAVQRAIFGLIRSLLQYTRRDLWIQLATYYMPSLATVAAALLILGCTLFIPHVPMHFALVYQVLQWPKELGSSFDDQGEAGFSHLFEGLIVVVIALIVFVAESVRTSRSGDEKRVLLKISNLWPLAVLITILPFGFLYPPATVLSAALVIAVALLTVYSFAKVLQNLIDPETGLLEQRAFLKSRVERMVMESARQRVGNRILFDEFGPDAKAGIRATISKSFIPGNAKNYQLFDVPSAGILVDINMHRLRELAHFLQEREEENQPDLNQAVDDTAFTTGPSKTAPKANTNSVKTRAYLLRRYGEEVTEDSVFSSDRALIAIHKDIAKRPNVHIEVESRIKTIFKFDRAEPSSAAFRREMQSTKDLLIAAIKESSLGEIEQLRTTYLLVAEQFLITLNNLGGGYTAQQAKEERRSFLSERWNEVRWLTTDVRDLLAVAAAQSSVDVVRLIAVIPFLVAIRAFQAGDQLLFQEFTSFATYLFVLGRDKAGSTEVSAYLVRKSWEYVKEIFDNYLETSLPGDDDD